MRELRQHRIVRHPLSVQGGAWLLYARSLIAPYGVPCNPGPVSDLQCKSMLKLGSGDLCFQFIQSSSQRYLPSLQDLKFLHALAADAVPSIDEDHGRRMGAAAVEVLACRQAPGRRPHQSRRAEPDRLSQPSFSPALLFASTSGQRTWNKQGARKLLPHCRFPAWLFSRSSWLAPWGHSYCWPGCCPGPRR